MRATHAAVLRETNPAMRTKVARFDLIDGGFDQSTELPALCFGNRGSQILDFWMVFANEDHKGHF